MKAALVFCLLILSVPLAGQTEDTTGASRLHSPPIVRAIIITGNKVTQDFVITREMTLQPGSTITPEAIQFDRERIYSLRLFNRVDIRTEP